MAGKLMMGWLKRTEDDLVVCLLLAWLSGSDFSGPF
jgi:hypothetical protein